MRNALSGLRILYGAFWLIFGLNGFLHFFSVPAPSEQGAAFMAALETAGYVMPLVYGSQVVAGTLLLCGCYITLALLILAPVVGNIMLYDWFLNLSGLTIGIILLVIYLLLVYAYRQRLAPLLMK
jgi:hypothetical protein